MTNVGSGIYVIEQIGTDRLYVGSAKHIDHRWSEHRRRLTAGGHHSRFLQNAWNKYGPNAFRLFVLEECPEDQLLVREQAYIDTLRPTFNVSLMAGRPDPQLIARMVTINRARAALITHCPRGHLYDKANTILNQGKRVCRACGNERMRIVLASETPEKREARRQRMKAYYQRVRDPSVADRWSPEHRARISAGQRGHVVGAATREKLRAANIGKTHTVSEETRAKISASNKGRIISAEMREKIRATLQGDRTTCKYGHPFDLINKHGRRLCHTCTLRRKREYRQRLRAA